MEDADRVKLRFTGPWPTWRVIVCGVKELERELRQRNFYDLAFATQDGPTYTLFLKLKDALPAAPSGEHVFKESPNAP